MECAKNLDTKYQNLATEYSKLRANAAVLKKALLDEQVRSKELKDQLKEHEQKLRKSNQEMESLTFRNQQLTKRIVVLQEELDLSGTGKRSKGKNTDINPPVGKTNITLLDEELQKKIIDNAQLISAMTDKDLEISNLREILSELEGKLLEEQKQRNIDQQKHNEDVTDLKKKYATEIKKMELKVDDSTDSKQNGETLSEKSSIMSSEEGSADVLTLKQQTLRLQREVEHWRSEYELLASNLKEKGEEVDELQCDQKTKDYFYQRIDKIIAEKQEHESHAISLSAECTALEVRLELVLQQKTELEKTLETHLNCISKLQEEVQTTSHNYEQQLSTMSEHLADLNDKYTEQCELIQDLNFQISKANVRPSKHTK